MPGLRCAFGAPQILVSLTLSIRALPAQTLAANQSGPLLVASLPDAPGESSSSQAQNTGTTDSQQPSSKAQTTGATPSNEPHQTKRIFGIVPNYRSVSAHTHLPAQSPKEKFTAAFHDSFDYGSFVLAAVQAGFAMNSKSYPEFHQGVVGYGRYYWHTLADTADENFMVGGVLPVALHQDPRFYTLGHGTILHRALYASTRVLITRTDGGRETVNASEIIGAGAASGISSTYYPAAYRTWTKVGVLIDSANFTFKEFWPDINSHLPGSIKE